MKRHHRFGLGAILALALLLTTPASIAHQGDPGDAGEVRYECSEHINVHLEDLAGVDDGRLPTPEQQQDIHAAAMQIVNILEAIGRAVEAHDTIRTVIRVCVAALTGGIGL